MTPGDIFEKLLLFIVEDPDILRHDSHLNFRSLVVWAVWIVREYWNSSFLSNPRLSQITTFILVTRIFKFFIRIGLKFPAA